MKNLLKKEDSTSIVEGFKITIRGEDLKTLKVNGLLNDEIVNFYLSMVAERSKTEGYPSVHAFNSFFLKSLVKGGFMNVARWTKNVKIFEKDFLLIPINFPDPPPGHWVLVVVDVKKKLVQFLDSLGSSKLVFFELLCCKR